MFSGKKHLSFLKGGEGLPTRINLNFKCQFNSTLTGLIFQLKFNLTLPGGEVTPHQDGTFLYNEPLRLFGFWFPIGRDSNLSAPGITWAPILKSLTNVTSTSENTIFRCASNSISSFEVVTVTFLASASSRLSSLFSFTKNLYNRQKILLLRGACSPRRCDTWERVLVVRPRFSRPAGHQEVPQDWTGATMNSNSSDSFVFWLWPQSPPTHNVGWHERLAGVQGRRQGLLNCNHLLHDGEHSYHHIMRAAQGGGVGSPFQSEHFQRNCPQCLTHDSWLHTPIDIIVRCGLQMRGRQRQ